MWMSKPLGCISWNYFGVVYFMEIFFFNKLFWLKTQTSKCREMNGMDEKQSQKYKVQEHPTSHGHDIYRMPFWTLQYKYNHIHIHIHIHSTV